MSFRLKDKELKEKYLNKDIIIGHNKFSTKQKVVKVHNGWLYTNLNPILRFREYEISLY